MSAQFIYATLLHIDNPSNCCFKITPSASFLPIYSPYALFLSLQTNKRAKKTIRLSQLNAIITSYAGFQFQFQDRLSIDQILTFNDLPTFIDGDLLYQANARELDIVKQVPNYQKYELRYINRLIGFGVYAREVIKQGDIVCYYYGSKQLIGEGDKSYFFNANKDSLNLGVNARYCGNIARFINHASSAPKTSTQKSRFLAANLTVRNYWFYGIEIIYFCASRPILIGELLLVDYGKDYFSKKKSVNFTADHHIISSNNQKISQSFLEKRDMLKIMANNGITEALWLLVKRPFIVLIVVFLLYYWDKTT